MSTGCAPIVIKDECTTTRDIILMRPVAGRVRIADQGEGIKRSIISVAGDIDAAGSCSAYGENCSGVAMIGSTETIYSGTPYKITTIRCAG